MIRLAMRSVGLYGRGQRNAHDVQLRHHHVRCPRLPGAFDRFTILHISDMHADMSQGAMRRVIELLGGLDYDACVLTGDFRGAIFEFKLLGGRTEFAAQDDSAVVNGDLKMRIGR